MNRSFKLEEFHFFFIKFSCMVIEYKGKYTLFVDFFFYSLAAGHLCNGSCLQLGKCVLILKRS